MTFAEISKNLRAEKNISQTDLAKNLGVSKACISMIEIGKNEPTARTLIAYSDFFGCSIDFLLGREDDFGVVLAKRLNSSDKRNLTEEENQILKAYRALSPKNKELFVSIINNLKKDR